MRPDGEAASICLSVTAHVTPEQGILVRWDPPVSDGGWPISSYELMQGSDENLRGVNVSESTTPSGKQHVRCWCLITKVPPNTPQRYRVRALNIAGVGQWSDYSNSVFTEAQMPGQIVSLVAEAHPQRNSVLMRWEKPGFDGGAPILHYMVEFAHCDANGKLRTEWQLDEAASVDASTRAVIDKLPASQRFVFRVRAVNAAGTD